MQVGARSVKRAKVVRDAGCEGIAAAVASGDLSLRAAERLSRSLSREEQEQLAAQGVEAMQQRADRLAKAATKIATPKPDEVLAALAARIADAVPLSMAEVNDWRGRPPRLEMRQEDGLVLVSVDAENRAAILARINEGSDAGDDDAGA
jgi:acyl-CoA reductase-like NAD-dependent aldehyde dehydrogenase